jgi:hypothetical protein
MTVLQKHASFFDRNKDGIITPSETFEGNFCYTLNSAKKYVLSESSESYVFADCSSFNNNSVSTV